MLATHKTRSGREGVYDETACEGGYQGHQLHKNYQPVPRVQIVVKDSERRTVNEREIGRAVGSLRASSLGGEE